MIKNILTINVFIISQLLLSSPSFAQPALNKCEKVEQTAEQHSRCLDSVKIAIDRELQIWVNNHIFNLEEKALITGRYSALKMFKRSQSDFITFRDNNCRWQYLATPVEGNASLIYKQCYISLSQSRIKELSQVQ